MTKADLVSAVAETGMTKKQAGEAVDAMMSAITGALKKGDRVSLVGFGSFSVKKRKARMGRNPQTGEAMKIKAKKVPAFSAGKLRQNFVWQFSVMSLAAILMICSSDIALADDWTEKADMPTARALLATSVVDGKLYAMGGWIPGGAIVPTVEIYDPETDTWTRGKDLPGPRVEFSTSIVRGKIYAIGGTRSFCQGWQVCPGALPLVEEYDTGFTGVTAEEKLAATWGAIKQSQ
jgi:DNA-binding protein HU-beta